MTKEEAEEFFAVVFRGRHHVPGEILPWGRGWTVCTRGDLSTFDSDLLTRLTFHAHDAAVRAEVSPAGFYLRIAIHGRGREGGMGERHPGLGEALAEWRDRHPEVTE